MFDLIKSCILGDTPFFLKRLKSTLLLNLIFNAIPRGVGQVCFINNSVTGFIFLLSLMVTMPLHYSLLSLLGLTISTIVSMVVISAEDGSSDGTPSSVSIGVEGFNGFLFGAAISVVLVNIDDSGSIISKNIGYNSILVVLGGIFCVFISCSAKKLLSQFSLPVSSIPFNLSTLMVISALRFAIDASKGESASTKFSFVSDSLVRVEPQPSWNCFPFNSHTYESQSEAFSELDCIGVVLKSTFRGMGQLYFSGDWRVGCVMVLSSCLFSPLLALLTMLGSIMGVLTGSLIDAHPEELEAGMWGFNPVLTAIALGGMYFRFEAKSVLFAITGSVFTAFMQGMIKLTLTKDQLPHFSVPFVVTSIIFFFAGGPNRIPFGDEGSPELCATTSPIGVQFIRENYWKVKEKYGPDLSDVENKEMVVNDRVVDANPPTIGQGIQKNRTRASSESWC